MLKQMVHQVVATNISNRITMFEDRLFVDPTSANLVNKTVDRFIEDGVEVLIEKASVIDDIIREFFREANKKATEQEIDVQIRKLFLETFRVTESESERRYDESE